MASPETKIPEIKRKMHFKGKVLKTTLAGAIVDVGMNKPGVVHIAHMSDKPVKRVEDVLQIGAEVDVWIRRVIKDANHIELTMIEPHKLDWSDIKKGMVVTGKVVRLEKFGAFIEIGAERPGLAHISELNHEYVKTPEDAVKIGEEVEAKILEFSRRKKQIKLSLKALKGEKVEEVFEVEDEEIEETSLTAMEIAYQRAIKDQNPPTNKPSKTELIQNKTNSEQADLLARTLKHKAKTK
jgi:ribosomal protein S1